MPINEKDRAILRGLAERQVEIASLSVHKQTILEWKRLNANLPGRPLVWINEIPWHEMDVNGELTLQTTDPFCQALEGGFRRTFYQWEHVRGDMVVGDRYYCPLVIHDTGFGISEDVRIARTDERSGIISREFHSQIDSEDDLVKIKTPVVTYDEEATSGGGKLVWTRGVHTAVFGVDINSGNLDQTITAGSVLQAMGAPATSITQPEIDRWAVYANDTIAIDRWSITPGIRYDRNNISGSFVSPSLGATCQLGQHSILRASVAKGFTLPPLSWTSGGALFLDPNPALDPEEVWSYQAGFESTAAEYLWIKGTAFRHELKNALTIIPFGAGPPTFNDLVVNRGEIRREGIELEVETLPVYNLSLLAGFAYVDLKPANESGSTELYSYLLGIRYDDGKSFRGILLGRYVWWDLDFVWQASYDDFIWDLNLNKRIYAKAKTSAELFATAHNLFNGAQYTFGDSKNPDTWVEAGIRVKF